LEKRSPLLNNSATREVNIRYGNSDVGSVKACADVSIPLASVEEIGNRFVNTLYVYFIGKRLAFHIVENYVKNTWAKFGIEQVMLKNSFFFQSSTKECMEKVIENGPWLIRLVPIILNVWTPNARLKNDEITTVHVWVKLHNVPIVAFFPEIGLSLIITKLGRPIMLDAYTCNLCVSHGVVTPMQEPLLRFRLKSIG
ncbi:zinc knuckle CX2CX4HX4C containing protein, partial [Tanacetum coccineum]